MFAQSPVNQSNKDKSHKSSTNNNSAAKIELVHDPKSIDKEAAKSILVESFIGEYKKYLSPNEISHDLTSWHDGEKSVKKYYENYFETEFKEFSNGQLDYWVQATIKDKLVGWATFQREKSNPNAIYMNLLIVDPEHQRKGIGEQLVKALLNLCIIPNLSEIHLLLRKKNRGGREFYSKLGFYSDPEYKREDNFVDMNLLEGLTWKNPSLQNKDTFGKPEPKDGGKSTLFAVTGQEQKKYDTYCGFKPGFLLGKTF